MDPNLTPVIWVGDLLPNLVFTCTSQPSNTPLDISSATCTVLFGPGTGNTNPGFVGNGSGAGVTNVYTYQMAAPDTAYPGIWEVQLFAVFPGSLPQHLSTQIVVIQAPVAT